MSNDTNTSNETTTATKSKRPGYTAYTVRDYEAGGESKADWTRVGIAWAHRDGKGLDIILEALPVNGRVVIRKNKPKSERQPEQGAAQG